MGLMYPFPTSPKETDHYIKNETSLTLKSYGLPYIFWLYLFATLLILSGLFVAIRPSLQSVMEGSDRINYLIGVSVYLLFTIISFTLVAFYFYEKSIIKTNNLLCIKHKLFGITFKSKKFKIAKTDYFSIDHFLDSPNIARLNNTEYEAFKNRGYHILYLVQANQKIFIDRHSQKRDLKLIKEALENN